MWRKIVKVLPLSFPPAVNSIHWMRPNQKVKRGFADITHECNISRSVWKFYNHETVAVSDDDVLRALSTTHNMMMQCKDVLDAFNALIDPNGAMQVVYRDALDKGASFTAALKAALCIQPDEADPHFDRIFYFIPKEDDPNAEEHHAKSAKQA